MTMFRNVQLIFLSFFVIFQAAFVYGRPQAAHGGVFMTNAARMREGLPLLKPRKLYNPSYVSGKLWLSHLSIEFAD